MKITNVDTKALGTRLLNIRIYVFKTNTFDTKFTQKKKKKDKNNYHF